MEEEQESFEQDKHCCAVGVFLVFQVLCRFTLLAGKGSVSRYLRIL